ncbi:hypothetical protein GP486_003011 [Trichoglossum hirsutum]|uniref:Uncharacterized protein n=1 Tax=Trichoglossum hirsutum TaxID=265104 RepID=A0A9P8LE42_9PEZI|nr:hypothetical protein GP486_003011 [Trichoglossum hirsutum]
MSQAVSQEHDVVEADEVSSSGLSEAEGFSQPKVKTSRALQGGNTAAAANGPAPASRGGRRIVPVHQSRIKDRPAKKDEKDSSLKIKIELDLEVEVEIYARVKGDVTIGLM